MKIKDILTREQEAAGLTLHDDEDMVYLVNEETVLTAWSAKNVTRPIILVEAQNILDKLGKMKQYSRLN